MTNQSSVPAAAGEGEKAILNACASGDIEACRHFFAQDEVRGRNKLTNLGGITSADTETESGDTTSITVAPKDKLLEQAVTSRQARVVHLLLDTYPSISLDQCDGIVRAVLENPDTEVLQALCNHDRTFSSYCFDGGFRTFLTEACTLPPSQAVPILHVLLDNDADVDDGWGPGGGALFAAIVGKQPVEIVKKILSRSEYVDSRHIMPAIRQGRVDVIGALFLSGRVSANVDVAECIEEAEKQGDKGVMRLVQDLIKRNERGERSKAGRTPKRRWWAFGGCDLNSFLSTRKEK
ncbi:hypothetical protein F4808DRAFT_321149 [Astrocystis sublimbata]|nr:hypothetical protein F4808DRAFT_321149 [Astrocystis sublimbata]